MSILNGFGAMATVLQLASWAAAGVVLMTLALGLVAIVDSRASAAQRHAILLAALCTVLALPGLGLLIPATDSAPRIVVEVPAQAPAAYTPSALPTSSALPAPSALPTRSALPTPSPVAPPSQDATLSSNNDVTTEGQPASAPESRAGASLPVGMLVLAVWGLGSLAVLTWVLIGVAARVLYLGRGTRVVTDPTCLRELGRARSRLGVRRPVQLRESDSARVPATWGSIRPTIVLPVAALSWPQERLRAALFHEMAHVARCDHLCQTLARLACVVHWFNPLVWFASSRMLAEAERASDDHAVAASSSARAYARELVAVARALRGRRGVAATTVAMARTTGLEDRIDAILNSSLNRRRAGRATTPAIIVGVLLLAVPLAAWTPRVEVLNPDRTVLDPDRTVLDPDRTVLDPDRAVIDPDRTVIDPVRGAIDPVRTGPTFTSVPEASLAASHDGAQGLTLPESGPLGPLAATETVPAVPADRVSIASLTSIQEAPCIPGETGSLTEIHNGKDDTYELYWDTGDCEVEIDLDEVRFSADETEIESIGRDGRFVMKQEWDGRTMELRARPESERIVYDFRQDGRTEPFDANARAWLASMIPTIFRVSGIQMPERVDRLLARGGVPAVLAEIRLIRSDHTSGRYIGELLSREELSDTEVMDVFAIASETIQSDHEMGEILRRAWRPDLSSSTRAAFLDAARTVQSDHEVGELIQTFFERGVSGVEVGRILELAEGIQSDHELGEVLQLAIGNADLTPANIEVILQTARSIQSDHEMGEVLVNAIQRAEAAVGAATPMFLEMARTIQSDSQAGKVLTEFLSMGGLSDADLIGVLDVADDIGSDSEHARLLQHLVQRHAPLSDDVLDRVVASAEGIRSDRRREQTLAAILRGQN